MFFTSNQILGSPLLRDLEKIMFDCTFTVTKNRKGFPIDVKNKKLEKNQSIYFKSGNLISMKCIDKRRFFLTNYDFGPENIHVCNNLIKPYQICRYNHNKVFLLRLPTHLQSKTSLSS